MPVSQVLPFDVRTPYPKEINGTPMLTYIDWMRVGILYIGNRESGIIGTMCIFKIRLPIGLQIVGRHNADLVFYKWDMHLSRLRK
jgi:amidase